MSQATRVSTNWSEQYALTFRSQDARSGVRKSAKKSISRRVRRQGTSRSLTTALSKEQQLEAMADILLAQAGVIHESESIAPEEFPLPARMEVSFVDLEELSTSVREELNHLEASLPDWMLSRIQDEKASAFTRLELFEAPGRATPARFYKEDDFSFDE